MISEKRKAIPKAVRDRVKNMYGGRCAYCGTTPSKLCIDHVEPIAALWGTNVESNLKPACFQCNNFKSVLSLEEFRNQLQCQVDRAREYSVNFRFAEKYEQVIVSETPIVFYFEKVKNDQVHD